MSECKDVCLESIDMDDVEEVETKIKKIGKGKGLLAKLAALLLLLLTSIASIVYAELTPIPPLKLDNRTITPCYIYVIEKPVTHYVTVTVTKTVTKTVTQVKYIENPAMSILTVVIPLLAAAGAFAGNVFSKKQVEEVKEL